MNQKIKSKRTDTSTYEKFDDFGRIISKRTETVCEEEYEYLLDVEHLSSVTNISPSTVTVPYNYPPQNYNYTNAETSINCGVQNDVDYVRVTTTANDPGVQLEPV